MHAAALRALEFDRIRAALAREASTSLGRSRAAALLPAVDPDEVRQRLALTEEATALVKAGGLTIDSPADLGDILAALDVAGEPLAPLPLLGLARFVASADAVIQRVRDSHAPRLTALVRQAPSFGHEVAAVRRAVDPSGDVLDAASPALRDIRDALRRQRAKLRSTLEGLTRGRDTAKYLQDDIITDRNGRYVIVVRAEYREAIPGLVHGASASGASLYVEPMATVALNNDVVALVERERAEIHRILLALTDAFRGRGDDLRALIEAAAAVDEVAAKARLSARMDGRAPEITDGGHLEFRGARHPLLIPAVRDLLDEPEYASAQIPADRRDRGPALPVSREPVQVIPSDLLVSPPARALVISGPNTGGKTVALKAFGLLALMAQSGIPIPVDPGSRLTPFRTVFADIGDEQSIAASLSTFSARIANLVAIDRDLALPSLVLLDEVGGGTDPVEGGALGAAVIDHLRRRGAIVVATTHDDALKSYGATTEGVAVAAFGFDGATFAPTYRLRYGAPGRSLALEVARRLGLAPEVIADAERRRSGRESLLAAHLARVDQELAAVERQRREVQIEREALAAERRALLDREARLAEREAMLRKRHDDRLAERLREAKAEVDAVVARLRARADALVSQAEHQTKGRAPGLSTGDIGGARAEARAALAAIEAGTIGHASGTAEGAVPTETPAPGDRVWIASFGAEGIVRGGAGPQVEVDVRGKRLRVPLSALRVRPAEDAAATPARGQATGERRALSSATRELMLIGSTVDDAIARAEKCLDDAIRHDERRLRVVHGHGTGRLREAMRSFFRAHPLVASVAPAADHEGGDGATIVELRD